jgi:hypothetical protein
MYVSSVSQSLASPHAQCGGTQHVLRDQSTIIRHEASIFRFNAYADLLFTKPVFKLRCGGV